MDKNFIVKVVGRGAVGNLIMAFMLIRKAIRMSHRENCISEHLIEPVNH